MDPMQLNHISPQTPLVMPQCERSVRRSVLVRFLPLAASHGHGVGELGLDHLGDAVLVFELVSLVLQGEGSGLPTVQQQRTEVYVVHRENIVPKIKTETS